MTYEDNVSEPEEGDYIIGDAGSRGYALSEVGDGFVMYCGTREEAETAIEKRMAQEHFYPNIWTQSDHGNLELIPL